MKWQKEQNVPKGLLEILEKVSKIAFPNIFKLLQICSILQILNASAERSFSTPKLIKYALRTTMTEQRLNGLMLTSINRDLGVDFEKLIDTFLNVPKNRRLFV